MMKTTRTMLTIVLALSVLALLAGPAQATTYTWTGATDGDWNNPGNWDGNGVPVDTDLGNAPLDLNGSTDRIVFNAPGATAPVPTSNIPALGGDAFANTTQNTPEIDMLFGALSFSAPGWGNQGLIKNRSAAWTTTVGDGNTANGAASLTYSGPFSNAFMRDPGGVMTWTVNADGSLIVTDSDSAALVWSYGNDRWPVFVLDGGSFTVNDAVDLLRGSTAAGNSHVDLQAIGSSFTANFGSDFALLTDVQALIGPALTFRDTLNDSNYFLAATDNQDGTFTVQFQSSGPPIPEPATLALLSVAACGLGGYVRRRRKA